jgi:hypothetical protein
MSNATDYQSLLPKITATPDNKIMPIYIPINMYNQEAENVHHWAMEDKDALIARGLDLRTIKELLTATGACREAEARWFKERFGKQEDEKEWEAKSPAAYALRDRVVNELEFAYFEDATLSSRVDQIKEGSGDEDLIQDLANAAALGKANLAPLQKTKCDLTLLDKAEALSDSLPGILAAANGDKADSSAVKKIRDQAYTYLKVRVDEVRRYGKFVFSEQKDRQVGYLQHYRNKHNR